ncbi:hypothetical protein [Stygiolobus sp. CP8521M]|uniref:hypothetical protein n=1 Tax=Stygiolobus sp. CP8521M TaxID=3133136 RepID=UPI00307DD79B
MSDDFIVIPNLTPFLDLRALFLHQKHNAVNVIQAFSSKTTSLKLSISAFFVIRTQQQLKLLATYTAKFSVNA